MFNDLPISETLLTPTARKLASNELSQAFPMGKDRAEEFSGRLVGKVFFSLDPESSPYGDALDVVYVDPEIPIAGASEAKEAVNSSQLACVDDFPHTNC